MARSLSPRLQAALAAQETGEVVLAICTIDHPSILNGPLRVVNDLQSHVSNGDTYTAFPFQITLPTDTDEGLPRMRLVLDNIERTIGQAIRGIPPGVPPTVQVDLVCAATPDIIEASFPALTLRSVDYDQFVVEGELAVAEDDRQPFPAETFSPQLFPGLF
jgi:hypothetical protein